MGLKGSALRSSVLTRSVAVGTSVVDQLLFGISGFIVSWLAARELAAPDLASFAIAWQAALGIVALVSEAIVTPAIARFAGSPDDPAAFEAKTLGTLTVWSVGALIATGLVSLVSPDTGVAVAAIAVGLCGSAFSIVRGMRYAVRDVAASMRRNVVRLVTTVVLAAAALVTSSLSVATALAIGAVAFLVAAIWGARPRLGGGMMASAVRPFLAEAGWYTGATAIRIVGYSAGLILLVRWTRGSEDAAVVASLMILAGPTQVVSSGLPLLFMAELGASRGDLRAFRRALAEQFVLLSIALVLGLLLAAAIYSWWVAATVGDPALRLELDPAFAPFAALVSGIVFGSWISAAFKVLRLPKAFTLVTVLSAAGSLALVLTPLETVWLAAVPYLLVTPVLAVMLLRRSVQVKAGVIG